MANPQNIALGPDAQILVNGLTFAVIEGEATEQVAVLDSSDSFSSPFKNMRAGRNFQLRASFTAQRDSSLSIHVAPLLLSAGNYIDLKIFPYGVAGALVYHSSSFVLETWTGGWRAEGSPIQTIRFSGMSNGGYFLLGFPG